MDISSLINKVKGAKKSKEEKQKEIINEKIKDIEKIYEKVKKEKGKEKAIEEVTEMLKDFLSRSEDQELNAIIRGIKYDTTVPAVSREKGTAQERATVVKPGYATVFPRTDDAFLC